MPRIRGGPAREWRRKTGGPAPRPLAHPADFRRPPSRDRGWRRCRGLPSRVGDLLPPLQPAVPPSDQDGYRPADLRDAGGRDRRRRALQSRRQDGVARPHLFRGGHHAGAHHRAGRGQRDPAGIRRQPADGPAVRRSPASPQTWDQILLHVVPESVFEAMAGGDVLQIVVFSVLFAIALGMIGEKGRPVVAWCEALAETMFKFTNIVMHYAPIGVGRGDRLHGRARRVSRCSTTSPGWSRRSICAGGVHPRSCCCRSH